VKCLKMMVTGDVSCFYLVLKVVKMLPHQTFIAKYSGDFAKGTRDDMLVLKESESYEAQTSANLSGDSEVPSLKGF